MDDLVWGTIKYKGPPLQYEWFHFCSDGTLIWNCLWSNCENCKKLEEYYNEQA